MDLIIILFGILLILIGVTFVVKRIFYSPKVFLEKEEPPKEISGDKIDRLARVLSELEDVNRDIDLHRINYARNWEMYSNTNMSVEKAFPNFFEKRKMLHKEFREIFKEVYGK